MARTITFFDALPVTINPPISTLSLVPTASRVEMFFAVAGTAWKNESGLVAVPEGLVLIIWTLPSNAPPF